MSEDVELRRPVAVLQFVEAIFLPAGIGGLGGQALVEVGVVPLAEDMEVDIVSVLGPML